MRSTRSVAWPKRAAVGIMAVALLAAGAPTGQAGKATCSVVPQLRDATVNQGLGSYTTLARGKETLLRWFLSLPSCAGATASIVVTGGSLSVANGGTALGTVPTPTPAPASPFPSLVAFDSAPALDAPADLKFVVPGPMLAPPGVTTSFTASFAATIQYQAKTSTSATPVNGSVTFSTSALVERPTNGVRLLAVPLGNAAQPFDTQFSPGARAATINAVQTLSRLLPAPAGVGDLTASTPPVPGVRYAINPGLLDVSGLLGQDGKFCGTAANFDAVKAELAQFLQSYNAANPGAVADVVVGVFDAAISNGGAQGCAEGMAALGAPQAWVRAVPDAPGAPSITGALLAMEFAHTQGLVLDARDNPFNPSHSPNTAADGTSPNRGYNVALRSFLADDRTALTLSGTWNNNTVLYERDDWAFLLCRLGGSGTCPAPGGLGAPAGADPLFVMSGTTDGTAAGTSVVESYFTAAGLPTPPDPASSFRLLQKRGATVLRDDGVPVTFPASVHGPGGHDGDGPGLFSVALPFATAATTVQLVHDGDVLYEAHRNQDAGGADQPPVVTSLTVPGESGGPVNLTNDPARHDDDPALSDDGRLVAWEDGIGIEVMLADDPAVRATVPGGEEIEDPAWSSDGTRLAWVVNQDTEVDGGGGTGFHALYVMEVDPTKAPDEDGFFVGEPVEVYQNTQYLARLSHPSWEAGPAGSARLVVAELDGGLRRLLVVTQDGDAESLTPLDEDASQPSWSHTPGDNRIAYVRTECGVDDVGCDVFTILTIDPDAAEPVAEPLLSPGPGVQYTAPSWGTDGQVAAERITFTDPDFSHQIVLVPATGGTPTVVTDGPSDLDPSLAGDRLAFEREFNTIDLGITADVMLVDLDVAGDEAQVTGEAPEGTDPADLRLDLYVSCDGPSYPVAVGVPPASVAGAEASFSVGVDSSLACGDGTPSLTAVLSDGVLRSDATDPAASTPFESAPKGPVAEILSPRVAGAGEPLGTRFTEHEAIPLRGLGLDAEDGVLSGSALKWFLGGTEVATGAQHDLAPQQVGTYVVTLAATDSDGNVTEVTRAIEVVADADYDGIPAAAETCASDANPADANADTDGDGIRNGDDWALTGEPCVAAAEHVATADFDPDVLFATSVGRTVTVHVTFPHANPANVNPATITLSFEGGDLCAPASFPVLPGGWSTSGRVGSAKFDRQSVLSYLRGDCGLGQALVPVAVAGTSFPMFGSWSFAATDTFQLAP